MPLGKWIFVLFVITGCSETSEVAKFDPPKNIFGVWNEKGAGWDSNMTLDIRETETLFTNHCSGVEVSVLVPTRVRENEFTILERAERETPRGLQGCKISLAPMVSRFQIIGYQLELSFDGELHRFDFLRRN